MKTIVLISCVSQKGKQKAKAKDLYKGTLFTKSLAYAESLKPDNIFILSALYHLVDLNKEVEPYNVTLSYVPPSKRVNNPDLKILTKDEITLWGKKVTNQLAEVANIDKDLFVILAGKSYIEPIKKALKNIKEPMQRKRQGERIKFLTDEIIDI